MNSTIKEKIKKLKEEELKSQKELSEKIAERNRIKDLEVKAKLSEAKIWIENYLFDLIAKEDIRIEKINKTKTGWRGDFFLEKELQLSHYNMVPLNIPIESVIKAIENFDGLSYRSGYWEGYKDPDGPVYEPEITYYVRW